MGSIELDSKDRFLVRLDGPGDLAQFKAATKLADGADEHEVSDPVTALGIDVDNPFNIVALWGTDFAWSTAALHAALDAMVPLARNSLSVHTRSFQGMMRNGLPDFADDDEDLPGDSRGYPSLD